MIDIPHLLGMCCGSMLVLGAIILFVCCAMCRANGDIDAARDADRPIVGELEAMKAERIATVAASVQAQIDWIEGAG